MWIRNVQPRLNTNDTSYTDSRALENQLGRSQVNSFDYNFKINEILFLDSST